MADSSRPGSSNSFPRGSNRPKSRRKKSNKDVNEVFITASGQDDEEKLYKLLEEHGIFADNTAREVFGQSILSIAATYGRTSVIAEILKAGTNPVLKSTSQRIALHEACMAGHLESARLLADVTPDINVGDINGQTPAHLAASNGETKVLKMLLEKGASMVAKDNKGRQPAHLAAIRNHKAVLELLYKHGVNLDCQCEAGKTPIHYAAQYGSLESMRCLLSLLNCDLTLRDVSMNLPIHTAARYDKLECLKLLIKYGMAKDSPQAEGRTCTHIAAMYGGVNALHWLLEADCDVSLTDYFGNTPAHYAAKNGYPDCFNCCLQHDADLQIENGTGNMPLNVAKIHGHFLLMEKAVKNEVTCPLCLKKCEKIEYDRTHAPAPVERSITLASLTAYTSPLPAIKQKPSQHQKSLMKAAPKKSPAQQLAAKYFKDQLETL